MVTDGDTEREPDDRGATAPMPVSIENDVASDVTHERVADEPSCIADGDTESVQVGTGGGGGSGVTVTVAEHVTEPLAPVAVPVYVTVVIGDTEREPKAAGVTKPIPVSMLNAIAFSVVHESVAEFPVCIAVGFAERTQVGPGGGGG